MVDSLRDDEFMTRIAADAGEAESGRAPSRLKARLYSALVQRQAESGPLMSLSECHARGHKLCVFENLVRVAPVGESAKSSNICRLCHARMLAENFEDAPIYWPGCPYVGLKNS